MTHRQLARNLLRTPLQSEQHVRLAHDPRLDLTCIATALRAKQRQLTGLIGPIAAAALVAAKLLSNLRDGLIGFHEAVNLISFDLAEVFVIHRATSTGRSRSLEC
jgi:hypothetical protein